MNVSDCFNRHGTIHSSSLSSLLMISLYMWLPPVFRFLVTFWQFSRTDLLFLLNNLSWNSSILGLTDALLSLFNGCGRIVSDGTDRSLLFHLFLTRWAGAECANLETLNLYTCIQIDSWGLWLVSVGWRMRETRSMCVQACSHASTWDLYTCYWVQRRWICSCMNYLYVGMYVAWTVRKLCWWRWSSCSS